MGSGDEGDVALAFLRNATRTRRVGEKEKITNDPMPNAQPLIYRLIISLCGIFFLKIKVELWY